MNKLAQYAGYEDEFRKLRLNESVTDDSNGGVSD